jgi:hypothetical protein
MVSTHSSGVPKTNRSRTNSSSVISADDVTPGRSVIAP